jgi:hypothetical protein
MIVGGFSSHWFGVRTLNTGAGTGVVAFTFNNQNIELSTPVDVREAQHIEIIVTVDTSNTGAEVEYWIENLTAGTQPSTGTLALPQDFAWNTTGDELMLSENRSIFGNAFSGTWHDVFVANGTLSRAEVLDLIANHTALNP